MSQADQHWLRGLMARFGVRKLRVRSSPSAAKWPDCWISLSRPPVLTVTREWARQPAEERHKRLVHEVVGHLALGLDHGYHDGLRFDTIPESDEWSRAMHRRLTS